MNKYLIQLINSSNQWILSQRNGKKILINSYSSQQYIPFSIFKNQLPEKEMKLFLQRQSNNLPNTPKVKLFNEISQKQEMVTLLIENAPFSFQNMVQLYKNQTYNLTLLNIVLKAITNLQMLYKKYGLFKCSQGILKVAKGPNILIWINEDFSKNYPQQPLNSTIQLGKNKDSLMDVMIRSFLQVLHSKIPKLFILKQLLHEKQGLKFEFIKQKIMDQIKNAQRKQEINRRHSQVTYKVPKFIQERKLSKIKNKKMQIYKSQSTIRQLRENLLYAQQYENPHPSRSSFSTQQSGKIEIKKFQFSAQEQSQNRKIRQQFEAIFYDTLDQEVIKEQAWEDQLEIQLEKILMD